MALVPLVVVIIILLPPTTSGVYSRGELPRSNPGIFSPPLFAAQEHPVVLQPFPHFNGFFGSENGYDLQATRVQGRSDGGGGPEGVHHQDYLAGQSVVCSAVNAAENIDFQRNPSKDRGAVRDLHPAGTAQNSFLPPRSLRACTPSRDAGPGAFALSYPGLPGFFSLRKLQGRL